ncbi:hypothetical protein CAEBREN_28312 [Caenorhabditis brenneri]|uniref:Serpentine receptor class gamma n=1 Tax=Caenorhabditis brenneri TaxID=135651 RepID=G0NJ31_CAEBE|nr:hypothetical protein CAEBREN_28312 [Caenorhabditis brenneri]
MASLHTLVQRISAIIAVFNNILLIVLIVFKSHKKVGKYKYFMIYISVFELLYAVIDGCAAPKIFTKESAYIVFIYHDQTLLPPSFLPDLFLCFLWNLHGYFCSTFHL